MNSAIKLESWALYLLGHYLQVSVDYVCCSSVLSVYVALLPIIVLALPDAYPFGTPNVCDLHPYSIDGI